MITEAIESRIAEAIDAEPDRPDEVSLRRVMHPLPESRAEAAEMAEGARKDIVRAEWDAEGMRGATHEMQLNAQAELPVLRARLRLAELVVRVLDEDDAEPPRPDLLDGVGALFAVAMAEEMCIRRRDEALLAEQRHQTDVTDDAFARLAVTHPEACHTAADYPTWTPGGAQ